MVLVCKTRLLTAAQAETALRRGAEVNPANAPQQARTVSAGGGGRRGGGPRRLALLTARRWPASGAELTVQFLDNPTTALRKRLLLHMNAWGQYANVRFAETRDVGLVRVTRVKAPDPDAGFWSYIGTEILGIEPDQPTMNLEGFTMRTSEAEFRRLVRHEAGHTLGFEHEHMRSDLVKRIDRKKAIAYYRMSDNWSPAEVDLQVLTPLAQRSLTATTESDPLSIMCYQIPAEITRDGVAIAGGTDIHPRDHAFAARIYPKPGAHPQRAADAAARVDAVAAAPMAQRLRVDRAADAPAPQAAAADDTLQILVLDSFNPRTGQIGTAAGQACFGMVFASYAGARVMQRLQLKQTKHDGPTRFGRIIGMHERIRAYTEREHGTLPADEELIDFGAELFDTLFQGDVRRLYDEARARQQGGKLDLVLTSMIPWIAEKPWEFAFDRTRRSFLATEEVHFVRNALAAVPAQALPPRHGPLSILVAAAQPVGFGRLSVAQEDAVIRRGFEPLVEAGLARVESLARATPNTLLRRLAQGRFDIVHFIGHGDFDDNTGVGSLLFEDGEGGSLRVPERSLREMFCGRGIRLVFLNACQSGSGGRADFNKGVAQALVSHGLPALVANQYSVLDSSATSFAQHFYWALAQGMGIGQAAREARIAVNASMQGELIDWAVPVVYARDPAMVLCERQAQVAVPAPQASAARGVSAKARARGRRAAAVRVGVWDIDNVFPGLVRTLRRFNDAQDRFGFELVELSAPLDIWDLDAKSRAPGGTPYLRCEKLAARLAPAVVEQGVHVLACITRHWMRDERTRKLYGWWPHGRKPPVAVVSFAGFESLAVEGDQTDRALANLVVSALAGFTTGLDTHPDGAHDCPMWENPERLLSHITGRQHFDPVCRAALQQQHPRALQAFDALLAAFA